jgi:CDP-diglyceride synthetase
MVDGVVLMLVLPREVLVGVMRGGMATLGPLTVSILLGIGLMAMLARPVDPVTGRARLNGALTIMLLSVAIMSVTRHQVRALYLDPATGPYALDIVPQWGLFFLFVLVLVAALGSVAYMIKRVLGEPASGNEAA